MTAPRTINFWELVLYSTALTFGIRWLATAAAIGPASLPIWILAAVGFLAPLAIATAELAGRYEGEGAVYAWTRDTMGPFAGFVCGWIYWVCNLPFFSSVLFFFIEALSHISPDLQAALEPAPVRLAIATIVAIVIAGANLIGMAAGKWLPVFGAIASLTLLATLLIVGWMLGLRDGPATNFATADYTPPLDANGAILWATMVFGFAGAEAVALLRNDIAGGMKRLVRAIAMIGVFLVVAYVAGTIAMLTIVSPEQATRLSGLPEALQLGLGRVGAGGLAPFAMLLLALVMLGSYAAWFGAAARLPYAAGLDHVLPRVFAFRDPKTGAPVASIIVQTIAVVALVWLSQADGENAREAYDFLISMSTLSYTLPFLFLFAAYLIAQRMPARVGAWVAPGGKRGAVAIGTVGFLVTLSAVLCSLVPSPDAQDQLGTTLKLLLASAVLLLSGVVLYALALWRKR
ncbi:APC family permease [Terricaulis silvestris]|uniref:Inner membrane transporter YgjI n=1 Tax=Terricaulis silvestris TaxID=2686094 RepID=A0A6I6MNG2_9CAUL|nr:APC family permease [Terricaulis silvestris]QGZ94888.1 Inner membrane transporter YgjI [Terricaulis silvestris]